MNVARTLAALSDDTRREILSLLGERGSLAAGAIAEAFALSKPTISHHLKVLAEAELVRSERRGTSIVYTLQSNVLEDAAAALLALGAKRPKPSKLERSVVPKKAPSLARLALGPARVVSPNRPESSVMTTLHMPTTQPPAPAPRWSLDKLALAVIGAATLGSALVFPWLPARVPSHIDLHGHVDGSLPRLVGAFLLPAIALPVLAIVRSVARRPDLGEGGRAAMELLTLLTTLFLVGLHAMMLALALAPTLDTSRFLGVFLGLFWAGCALIFPRLRRNPVAGIRTPWTLASDENWARTHRFGGQVAFVAAVLAIAASLAGLPALAIGAVGISGVLPVVYSYWIR